MKTLFRELEKVYRLVDKVNGHGRVELLGTVDVKAHRLPIYGFQFGSKDPTAPTFGLFGGLHGLEKIGTELAVYFLYNLVERLEWNKQLQELLEKIRVVSIPLLNPGGMYLGTRSNPNGVDLNRTSPSTSDGKKLFLASGHRLSPNLPWYGGVKDKLEFENEILVEFVKKNMLNAKFSLALDLHSGFGVKDRLWFPYSKTSEPFPYYDIASRIKNLVDSNMKHHIYQIEPQADSYIIEGDIWDHLFDIHYNTKNHKEDIFVPWTLEMGSWIWVKKNPLQLMNIDGMFNPYREHRFKRVMRRHWRLLDLYMNLCANHEGWLYE